VVDLTKTPPICLPSTEDISKDYISTPATVTGKGKEEEFHSFFWKLNLFFWTRLGLHQRRWRIISNSEKSFSSCDE
jgi:hypothetical protein